MSTTNIIINNFMIRNKKLINPWPKDKKGRINFSSIFIAPRRSGKTTLIKYFVTNILFGEFDRIFVFTSSTGIEEYSEWLPKKFIFPTFRNDVVKKIMNINSGKKKANVLIICDDSCSRKQKFDNELLSLYTMGRHYAISIMYATQTPTLVDNIWKENSDFIFIFKQKIYKNKEYIINTILLGLTNENLVGRKKEFNYYMNLMNNIHAGDGYNVLVANLYKMNIEWFRTPKAYITN